MNLDRTLQQRLACLGDTSRYRMVHVLANGERCVTELARRVGLSQSCTTRHLQVLRGSGLVSRARSGKRVMFALSLADPAVRGLLTGVLAGGQPSAMKRGAGAGPAPTAGAKSRSAAAGRNAPRRPPRAGVVSRAAKPSRSARPVPAAIPSAPPSTRSSNATDVASPSAGDPVPAEVAPGAPEPHASTSATWRDDNTPMTTVRPAVRRDTLEDFLL